MSTVIRPPDQSPAASHEPVAPSFVEASRVWAKIGLINFGGPAGQIALMHRVLVEEKRWIDEPRFLHALSYCMLLPGPEAQQLATYIGWLMHGIRGGLVAGILFILPGFFVLLALSIAYALYADLNFVQGLLFGLKAAVLAIVTEALLRLSKRALKGSAMAVVAVAAFLAISLLGVPFPAIIAAAAILGLLMVPPTRAPVNSIAPDREEGVAGHGLDRPWRSFWRSLLIWGVMWLAPVALLVAWFGLDHVFTELALFFSKVAVVTFGGAYAVLAYVAQQAVDVHQWLRPDEMLTGLGLAETTPGPLILVLVFVGFLAGFRDATGFEPLAGGIAGAFITGWVIFAPSFLFIFAGAPFIERLRGNQAIARCLEAVTAAIVGVIANLALWFGLHVMFSQVITANYGPFTLSVPDPGSFDPRAALIAIGAGAALLHFHVSVPLVLAGAALAGVILSFVS